MSSHETITDFHQRYDQDHAEAGQVKVYRLEDFAQPATYPHQRRDFYEIKLMRGVAGSLAYADQRVAVTECALVFVNPTIPYSWQRLAGHATGFACLFTEAFVTAQLRTASMAGLPLFRVGSCPVVFPPPEAVRRLETLFESLLAETQSAYAGKYDLLRNYLQLILHEALKLAPAAPAQGTAATQLQARFLKLLAQQFPLASPQHSPQLKNANEFARQLAVHPTHLNKTLKALTGQTTTAHIAGRLVAEAQALLRHSNWSIAEIGYCLGFEHAANFTVFFRKQTGYSPTQYRRQPLAPS